MYRVLFVAVPLYVLHEVFNKQTDRYTHREFYGGVMALLLLLDVLVLPVTLRAALLRRRKAVVRHSNGSDSEAEFLRLVSRRNHQGGVMQGGGSA